MSCSWTLGPDSLAPSTRNRRLAEPGRVADDVTCQDLNTKLQSLLQGQAVPKPCVREQDDHDISTALVEDCAQDVYFAEAQMTPVKSAASDVHLWGKRFGHLGVVVFAVGISASHFDFAESRYLLMAVYLFLGNILVIALILLAAVNMVADNHQVTARSSPPVYAIPEWRKLGDVILANNLLMAVNLCEMRHVVSDLSCGEPCPAL